MLRKVERIFGRIYVLTLNKGADDTVKQILNNEDGRILLKTINRHNNSGYLVKICVNLILFGLGWRER